jgi:membrane-associated phospholipid phosphatase
MSIHSIDTNLIVELQAFLSGSGTGSKLFRIFIYNVGENPLLRGLPVFFPLLLLWFGNTAIEHRSRMMTGLLGVCVAVFVSVSMQYLLQVHTRPLLDRSLQLTLSTMEWDHQSSFPSDTAMLYFALSTVILLQNRWLGLFAFLWSAISAGLCRVALGWHYPSDVLGSLLIAPVIVILFMKWQFLLKLATRLLTSMASKTHIVNAILVLFLADAYNLFPGLRGIFQAIVRIARNNLNLPDQ